MNDNLPVNMEGQENGGTKETERGCLWRGRWRVKPQ